MEVNDFHISNTTHNDWNKVIELFRKAMQLQGKNGYKVWEKIDEKGVQKDINNGLQYKIVQHGDLLCVFSIQLSDPFIWQERDKGDAIYLHRIVVNPDFKGQKQFAKVLHWSKLYGIRNNLKYIRMDTWADNRKIIAYYRSFGFEFVGNHKTGNEPDLPIQNRNLAVALLELDLSTNNSMIPPELI
ncbi:GNAT family N-acetyltransferase [Sphingobacterium sp. N143]|uniref:GNAT family N-acetyltransferase n=1 Tax=Sphingobacterium sp. N143 TaxID=2746727 RepID=UPI002576360B|nr:GNAT family N-acetyltransferase [Sphingobacterium sp. N143]MDM1293191.1 GNAT family N-acetyltransferase [Sphingobacterium sp. N143]